MSSFQYSTEALNVKSAFYKKSFTIFVEGKDDILFWDSILCNIGIDDAHIEDTNGIDGLTEIMDRIINENAAFIVACDCDYSPFLKNKKIHKRIIRTYGYSIENHLYCPETINKIIRKITRNRKTYTLNIKNWIDSFCKSFFKILVLDLASVKFNKGVKILGDNCCRFLKKNNSSVPSLTKIKNFIEKIQSDYSEKEISECRSMISSDEREIRWLIKGSFLTNAVINYIRDTQEKETGQRVHLPKNNLYALSLDGCIICDIDCRVFEILVERLKERINSLN